MHWLPFLEKLRIEQQFNEDNRPVLRIPIPPPYNMPEEIRAPEPEDDTVKRGVIILNIFDESTK